MKDGKPISEGELEVLEALWDLGPATVRRTRGRLREGGRRWAYTTVKTLLDRLEEKGYVRRDASDRAHVFEAAVSREDLARRGVRELIERICGGSPAPLVRALVDDVRLSEDEARELRRLLDERADTG